MPPIGYVLIVLVLVFIVVGWMISTINAFRRMQVKIDESESSIDVALTKRYDLLTKMFAATKGYMKHEKETLTEVVAMRQPGHSASIQDKQEFANQMTRGLEAINVVVEQYPDLKANSMFNNLQNAIIDTEEHLQAARRLYNANVRSINHIIVTFPQSIVANAIKMEKKEFFEAEEAKRQDVKMTF